MATAFQDALRTSRQGRKAMRGGFSPDVVAAANPGMEDDVAPFRRIAPGQQAVGAGIMASGQQTGGSFGSPLMRGLLPVLQQQQQTAADPVFTTGAKRNYPAYERGYSPVDIQDAAGGTALASAMRVQNRLVNRVPDIIRQEDGTITVDSRNANNAASMSMTPEQIAANDQRQNEMAGRRVQYAANQGTQAENIRLAIQQRAQAKAMQRKGMNPILASMMARGGGGDQMNTVMQFRAMNGDPQAAAWITNNAKMAQDAALEREGFANRLAVAEIAQKPPREFSPKDKVEAQLGEMQLEDLKRKRAAEDMASSATEAVAVAKSMNIPIPNGFSPSPKTSRLLQSGSASDRASGKKQLQLELKAADAENKRKPNAAVRLLRSMGSYGLP